MTAPSLHIVIELEQATCARLVSFHLADEVRLVAELDARGLERLEREVLAALQEAIVALRERAAKATPADVWRRAA